MTRKCKQCSGSMGHKRKDAIYCSVVCKKAYHHTLSYTSPEFVRANNERSRKWRDDNPGLGRQAIEDWHEANPDRVAAIKGKEYALRNGSDISDVYDLDLCVPFYAEARRLTSETGVQHEVDHVLAISRGGLHCQTNLQVLTKSENLEKRHNYDIR